jgi:hypothetical protein
MAAIDRRRGKWRAQVRRGGYALTKTFEAKLDAEKWSREAERLIDIDVDPRARRFSPRDSFSSLIHQLQTSRARGCESHVRRRLQFTMVMTN